MWYSTRNNQSSLVLRSLCNKITLSKFNQIDETPQMKTNTTFKPGHESCMQVFRTIIKWLLFQFRSCWLRSGRLWVTDTSRGAPIRSTPPIPHWGSLIKLETERRNGEKDEGDREKRKTFSFLFSPPLPSLFFACLFVLSTFSTISRGDPKLATGNRIKIPETF